MPSAQTTNSMNCPNELCHVSLGQEIWSKFLLTRLTGGDCSVRRLT